MTRDEAIALCLATVDARFGDRERYLHMRGIRLALEALAAAGVFVDAQPVGGNEHDQAAGRLVLLRDMADKLDAAGIR